MKKSELKELIKSSYLAEAEDSKKGNSEEQKRMEGAIRDDRDHVKSLEKDIKDNEDKLAKLKDDYKEDVDENMRGSYEEDDIKEADAGKTLFDVIEDLQNLVKKYKTTDVNEGMRGAYEEDDIDENMRGSYEEDDIKEADEVDVEDNEDIDIDIEDDISIDDVSDKSEIEVDSELAGEDADISAILGLLTKAQEEAKGLGDEKLLDQIGNTITYYTRAHVVASTNEDLESGEYGDPVDAELDVTRGGGDVAGILDTEAALNLQETKRFRKLAGLIK